MEAKQYVQIHQIKKHCSGFLPWKRLVFYSAKFTFGSSTSIYSHLHEGLNCGLFVNYCDLIILPCRKFVIKFVIKCWTKNPKKCNRLDLSVTIQTVLFSQAKDRKSPSLLRNQISSGDWLGDKFTCVALQLCFFPSQPRGLLDQVLGQNTVFLYL